MGLRFGVGKKVGPFFVGATFGKKRRPKVQKQRIVVTVKSPKSSPMTTNVKLPKEKKVRQKKEPGKRWRDKPIFWLILGGIAIIALPTGFNTYADDGDYSGAEIAALILVAGLAIWFFIMAYKKFRKSASTANADTKLPDIEPPAVPQTFSHAALEEVDGMEGHQFEYFCADLLRRYGFENVTVTPASNDQGVDVLAEKDGIKYAIQCKNYASPLGNTPIQEVYVGKQIYGCQIGAVLTNSTFTPGAKAAAESTGILLWDRDKLAEFIEKSDK